ncbi:hypothetical protein CLV62_102115 [Dysgonomonas alginatilytica]|uniref:Lipoprotein n=1 Tax=Dysgonomonas alginatilytica TaxID=1605892 RepID=A0A2V3PUW9_9BACT|nr:hypothetical protein [Dysgonomonas alginatilytica]PXV68084.1 hypothetical protein CLV62_102115 [Dysgonomonas alginatilytica]
MTKKLLNLTKIALLIFSISFLLGSCTKENTYFVDPQGDFAYVLLKDNITINANQWNWDPITGRYKASVSFPELQKNDYEAGMAVGNIYIFDNDGKENVLPLPYIRSYIENDIPFTETISCALSYDKKNVEFYIESSDKFEDPAARVKYDFKVALIFNFTY